LHAGEIIKYVNNTTCSKLANLIGHAVANLISRL